MDQTNKKQVNKKKKHTKKHKKITAKDFISGESNANILSETQTEREVEKELKKRATKPKKNGGINKSKKTGRKSTSVVSVRAKAKKPRAKVKHYKDKRMETRTKVLNDLIKKYTVDKKFIEKSNIFRKKPGKKMRKEIGINGIDGTAIPMFNLVLFDMIDKLAFQVVNAHQNDPKKKRTIQTKVLDSALERHYNIKTL